MIEKNDFPIMAVWDWTVRNRFFGWSLPIQGMFGKLLTKGQWILQHGLGKIDKTRMNKHVALLEPLKFETIYFVL